MNEARVFEIENVRVWENPTATVIEQILSRSTNDELRGLASINAFWVWDSFDASHLGAIHKGLAIDDLDGPAKFIITRRTYPPGEPEWEAAARFVGKRDMALWVQFPDDLPRHLLAMFPTAEDWQPPQQDAAETATIEQKRAELIRLAVAHHRDKTTEEITQEVMRVSDADLDKFLRWYRSYAQHRR